MGSQGLSETRMNSIFTSCPKLTEIALDLPML
jgi:hypothetical protein